jgi:hypothetical protein
MTKQLIHYEDKRIQEVRVNKVGKALNLYKFDSTGRFGLTLFSLKP